MTAGLRQRLQRFLHVGTKVGLEGPLPPHEQPCHTEQIGRQRRLLLSGNLLTKHDHGMDRLRRFRPMYQVWNR